MIMWSNCPHCDASGHCYCPQCKTVYQSTSEDYDNAVFCAVCAGTSVVETSVY